MKVFLFSYSIFKDWWVILLTSILNLVILAKFTLIMNMWNVYSFPTLLLGSLGIVYSLLAFLGSGEIQINSKQIVHRIKFLGLRFYQKSYEMHKIDELRIRSIDRATYWGFQGFSFSKKCNVLQFYYNKRKVTLGRWYENFEPQEILTAIRTL